MASATAAMTVAATALSPSAATRSQRKAAVEAFSTQKPKPAPARQLSGKVSTSPKDKAIAGLTAAALAAAMVVPEMAGAAQPTLSPSLNNFLLSIASGGAVLGAIIGAVVGVSNFDPVKRT
ncbi:hypothetical protein KSP39_PZI014614 [Platanthera zijinensis]|uniref:Photosystem II subunit X n=1 Tax=Platanthera zijinensis TaxID=2320716 RepID=A0AAP0BAJ7_9ASPA